MVKKAVAVFLSAAIMGIGLFGSYATKDVNTGENAQPEEQRGFSLEAEERKKGGEKPQREDGNMPPRRDFEGAQNEKNNDREKNVPSQNEPSAENADIGLNGGENSADERPQNERPQNEENREFPDGGQGGFDKPEEGTMIENFEFDKNMGGREKPNRGDFPPEVVTEEAEGEKNAAELIAEYKTPIFSLVILAAAFVFVIFYRRKQF